MEKETAGKPHNKIYTQDRELSWLKFNKRVLEEADDKAVPLLERLKFVSIFMTNLDEFYMIRVGRLNDLNKIKVEIRNDKSGLTPGEQLELIFEKTRKLIRERDSVYSEITSQLREYGIYDLKFDELDKNERKHVENYFKNRIQPVLSPMIIDNQHQFPHLANKQLYVLATLRNESGSKNMKIGIFTGTFDPFTIGHQNIAERALPMFDKLVIAVAVSKLKHASEEISKRVEDIKAVFPKECSELVDAEDASKGYRLEVVSYDDLTIDLAHRLGARFLVRGVRSAKDFEYEREQADINKQLGGVETILLFSDPRYSSISSTLVRELRFFGREVDEFLPKIK